MNNTKLTVRLTYGQLYFRYAMAALGGAWLLVVFFTFWLVFGA